MSDTTVTSTITVTIDGHQVTVSPGTTLYDVASLSATPPDNVCWQPARQPHRCALARLGSGARGRGESRPPGERTSRACGAGQAGRPQQQREGSQGAWSGSMVWGGCTRLVEKAV